MDKCNEGQGGMRSTSEVFSVWPKCKSDDVSALSPDIKSSFSGKALRGDQNGTLMGWPSRSATATCRMMRHMNIKMSFQQRIKIEA